MGDKKNPGPPHNHAVEKGQAPLFSHKNPILSILSLNNLVVFLASIGKKEH